MIAPRRRRQSRGESPSKVEADLVLEVPVLFASRCAHRRTDARQSHTYRPLPHYDKGATAGNILVPI